MLSISLEGQSGVLATLDALSRASTIRSVMYAMAESYNDDVYETIDSGSSFATRTGQLAQSVNWTPTTDGAEVYANAQYAPYVELGTRPHLIVPKAGRKGLRFFAGGGYVLARQVNHPGSKPYPFLFADMEARRDRAAERGRSVLETVAANAT